MSRSPSRRFSNLDKLLHWTMAALFVWQFVSRWVANSLSADHPAAFHLVGLHSVCGLAIFALGVIRIYRAVQRAPARKSTSPALALAAKANHAFLYGVMVVQPVTGFLSVGDKPAAEIWDDAHSMSSFAILIATTIHVAAALWHHFVQKDSVLRDMFPVRMKQ